MELKEVQELPRAPMYAVMVQDLLKDMGSPIASAIHAALGVMGEVAEMIPATIRDDFSNTVEEAGDAQFYAQGLLNIYGWALEEMLATSPAEQDLDLMLTFDDFPLAAMTYFAGGIIDELKKTWAYNKELNLEGLKYNLGMFYCFFEDLLKAWDLTFEDVKAHNQNKLVTGPNARYPSGKYSDAAAVARADKQEIKASDIGSLEDVLGGLPG